MSFFVYSCARVLEGVLDSWDTAKSDEGVLEWLKHATKSAKINV